MPKLEKEMVEGVDETFARVLARLLPIPRKIVSRATDLDDICAHAPINLEKFQQNWLKRYDLLNYCENIDEFLTKAEKLFLISKDETGSYYLTNNGITYVTQVRLGRKKVEEEYDKRLHDSIR